MKKHIVIATILEFGGGNSHLQYLTQYLAEHQILLLVESSQQVAFLKQLGFNSTSVHIIKLHPSAQFRSSSLFKSAKEALQVIKSIIKVSWLAVKNRSKTITISAIESEKYFYLMWIPFIKVVYILHSKPLAKGSRFTDYSANILLQGKKEIITVSNANKNDIIQSWNIKKKRQDRIHVIHNYVDTTFFNHEKNSKKEKIILTLGHVAEYKNPEIWLQTALRLTRLRPEVRFIWAGNGVLFEHYKSITENLERISFIGFTREIKELFLNATIYYQPSLIETHGIAVLEAMSFNIPCVVSRVGGLPETVESDYNGLVVDPSDLNAHVEAISMLLDNHSLVTKLVQNSQKRLRKDFSKEIFQQKMNIIYRN